jgi:putative ABC transport system permease protein
MRVYQATDQGGKDGRLLVSMQQVSYSLAPAITRTIHEISLDQLMERASTLQNVRAGVLTPDKLNALAVGWIA